MMEIENIPPEAVDNKMIQNDTEKTPLKQKHLTFIKAYLDNRGNISEASEDAGIGRATYYRWMKKPKFQVLFQEAVETHNDLVFQKILKLALESDKDMLKFWAKTQMRHRGFIEKQEIEHTGKVFEVTIKRANGESTDNPKPKS